jgi:hypothetical protein
MLARYSSSNQCCKRNERSGCSLCRGAVAFGLPQVARTHVLWQATPDPTDGTRTFRFRTREPKPHDVAQFPHSDQELSEQSRLSNLHDRRMLTLHSQLLGASSRQRAGKYDNRKFAQGSSALSRNKGKPTPVPGGTLKKRLFAESCQSSETPLTRTYNLAQHPDNNTCCRYTGPSLSFPLPMYSGSLGSSSFPRTVTVAPPRAGAFCGFRLVTCGSGNSKYARICAVGMASTCGK